MTIHTMTCADCSDTSERAWLRLAFSDADWHNTMTGHDVFVLEADEVRGTVWALTEDGWLWAHAEAS